MRPWTYLCCKCYRIDTWRHSFMWLGPPSFYQVYVIHRQTVPSDELFDLTSSHQYWISHKSKRLPASVQKVARNFRHLYTVMIIEKITHSQAISRGSRWKWMWLYTSVLLLVWFPKSVFGSSRRVDPRFHPKGMANPRMQAVQSIGFYTTWVGHWTFSQCIVRHLIHI